MIRVWIWIFWQLILKQTKILEMDIEDEVYSEEGFQEEEIEDEVLSGEEQKAAVDSKAKVQSKKEIEDDEDYNDLGEFAEISVKDESEEENKVTVEVAD